LSWIAALATVAVAAVAAAGATAATSTPAAGTPIQIAAAYPINTSLQNFEEVGSGIKAAVKAINAKGGINGHPLRLSTCDNQNDANLGAQCTRQAVDEHAVAAIFWHDNTYASLDAPIFASAKIPVFDFNGNPPDFVPSIGWGISGGPAVNQLATPTAFKRLGAKTVAFFTRDFPAATAGAPVVAVGARAAGVKFVGTVAFPTGTTDYSPYALKLKQLGADSVFMNTAFAQTIGIMKAAAQIGYNPIWSINGANVTDEGLAQLPNNGEGLIAGNPSPSWRDTSPGVKEFNKEMTASGIAPDDARHRGGGALAAWIDTYIFAGIAKQIKGPVTNASVYAMLNSKKVKPVNVFGLTTFDPRKKGPTAYPRMFGSTIYYTVAKGGVLVPDTRLKPIVALDVVHLH
jgi:branched-chain amino acid transport system substrate-binding protein